MRPGRVVFFTAVWAPGYGVATVIAAQARQLQRRGWSPLVLAARRLSGFCPDVPVQPIARLPILLGARLQIENPRVVIAATPPFFNCPPNLLVPWIHWEHGRAGCPEGVISTGRGASVVCAPSAWLARRMSVPALVVPNGADHLGRVDSPRNRSGERLAVVATLRDGRGEATYKGNSLLLTLPSATSRPDLDWTLLWRGRSASAAPFSAAGWNVEVNPQPVRMSHLWSTSDVHLAPSRRESFDLPLVEAQHLGCAGVALAGGAHAEVCPHVLADDFELTALLRGMDRPLVDAMRRRSHAHVADFTWDAHGERLHNLLLDLPDKGVQPGQNRMRNRAVKKFHRLAAGVYDVLRKVLR